MVRGLFLMPMDGSSSPGGEGWRSGDQGKHRRDQSGQSSNHSFEDGSGRHDDPPPRRSVADIIAACEALEKRAKEMQELARKKPEVPEKQPLRPIGSDGDNVQTNGPVYLTHELIDKAAELISSSSGGGKHVVKDEHALSRIPRDDFAAIGEPGESGDKEDKPSRLRFSMAPTEAEADETPAPPVPVETITADQYRAEKRGDKAMASEADAGIEDEDEVDTESSSTVASEETVDTEEVVAEAVQEDDEVTVSAGEAEVEADADAVDESDTTAVDSSADSELSVEANGDQPEDEKPVETTTNTIPDNEESAMSEKHRPGGNLRIEFSSDEQRARLKVIGVGGAGSNAVDNMISSQLHGVDFISVNTDAQALLDERCLAPTKVQIGRECTRGLGAGGNPEVGREAAEEDMERLRTLFDGADMVFVAGGMGGGTASGAAPVIAQLARDRGILTIGIVTKPFTFEGRRRMQRAEAAIEEMKEAVDTLIVIPNDKVFDLFKDDLPYHEAFKQVDQVLYQGTKGISDIINTRGFINVDFADAKSVMSNAGDAIMGIGFADGENRAAAAAAAAIDSPLLDNLRIDGARGILINITGGKNVGMKEVQQAVQVVTESAQEDADIYFGLVEDDSLGDKISVTVIATGFNNDQRQLPKMHKARDVEPTVQFRTTGRHPRPLKPMEEHDGHANGKNGVNGKNGTNGTNGTNGKNGINGHDEKNGKQVPREFVRVDAEPAFVDETSIDRNDIEVPAFLRRGPRGGKR